MTDYLEPYRRAVDEMGPGFEALLWRSRDFQQVRFRVLIETAAAGLTPFDSKTTANALKNRVIADLGCGRADMLAWLDEHRVPFGRYIGVEAIPELVNASTTRTSGRDDAEIIEADFAGDDDLFLSLVRSHSAEVFLFSGSLNTFEQPAALAVVERAFDAIRNQPAGAVVFNFLSSLMPNAPADDTGPAHRFDTHAVAAFAASLSSAYTVRHDYLRGHDATIGIFTLPPRR
ncbi:MAG: hypothetical protein AAF937_11315 [Planctomycetota bacterium]